ncbi:hypothetical protein GS399_14305 [Pedobacter sp. HMF7647]|uniref:Uncharacterized protein n=1 Tax=Hufsiella arboris TaxID=2695275 RepID=A0A7K1YC29_9SPHI|nr:hypothetical protein [Hufsiella arboris]MXV52147.1 hypothetical protein [Hufsiella arboris]
MKTIKFSIAAFLIAIAFQSMAQTKQPKDSVANNKSGVKRTPENTSHHLQSSPGTSDSVTKAVSSDKDHNSRGSAKDAMKKANPDSVNGKKRVTGYPGNSPKPKKD